MIRVKVGDITEQNEWITVNENLSDLLLELSKTFNKDITQIYDSNKVQILDTKSLNDGDHIYFTSSKIDSELNDTLNEISKLSISTNDWITLNVGGKIFQTTRGTLTKCPKSMLACMFDDTQVYSWKHNVDCNGAILIDRSPKYFEPILNYLRHGQLVIDKNINPQGVLEEAKFFGIDALIDILIYKVQSDIPPGDDTPLCRREFVLHLLKTGTNSELRCQGINFTGADLSKLDLRFINFKYAILKNANLSGANLSYCNLERANLSHANLDGANLLGAKMICANLEKASLQACNFEVPTGARTMLEGANMKNVVLQDSRMAGVNLRVATLKNSNLKNCDLRGAVLAGTDLENCDLSGSDLQEANLRGANLKGATFELMLNPLHMSQTVP